MKKVVIILFAVIALGGIGFAAYRWFQIRETRKALSPIVQSVTLRVQNDLTYEAQGSKVSYGELCDKIEKDLSEIDSIVKELQIIPASFNQPEIGASVDYAKSCQELMRTLLSKYRKQMEMDAQIYQADKAFTDYANKALDNDAASSSMGLEYARKSTEEAFKDFSKKSEESKETIKDVLKSLENIETVRLQLERVLPSKCLLDPALLQTVSKKNQDFLATMSK